jgi:hypothetical protein
MKTTNPFFPILTLAMALAMPVFAQTPPCAPPPPGIVGWWKGDGNTIDSVSSNNGVAVNVTFTTGVVGQAFACNSVDYGPYVGVQVPDRPAYALTNSLTIEGWVRPRGDGSIIFWRGDNRPGIDPYVLSMKHNNTVLFAITDANGNSANVETTLAYNQWIHLAATLDGASGTMRIYTNAMLAAQTVTSVRPFGTLIAGDSPGVGIGNLNDGQNNFAFLGDIDEISLYNRALLSSEITAIYEAGSSGKCVPALVTAGVPAIFNIAPTSGSNETVVTITGTNFSTVGASNNIVYFGAVRATVTSFTGTNLTVTVPVGATYAPITVTVNGLTAYSDQPFLPTFPGTGQINSSSLAPAVTLGSGNGPGHTFIGDLDGDGKPDPVEINAYDGSLWVYQNISTNGTLTTASFAPPVVFTFGGNVRDSLSGLAVADLVGDGRLDIVVANTVSNVISIFQNVSSPGSRLTTNSFAPRVNIPMAGGPNSIAVGDLDRDGKPDIVVVNAHNNTISVLRNISTGGVITANSFAPAVSFATPSNPNWLVVADIDGDGKPDVVTANIGDTSHGLSVFRNSSTSGNIAFDPRVDFAGLPQFCSLAIGDLDGDGKLDVAVSSFQYGQSVSLYRNTSTPGSITTSSFGPRVDFSVGGWGNTVAIGDLDGDGKPDLAVVTQLPDHLSIFKNISTPGNLTTSSFAARVDYPAGYNPNGIVIGDLSGDGRPDIVFGDVYDNTLSIHQNVIPTSTLPTITVQPKDAYVYAYDTATFTVTATGASSYHWLFNGSNLLNATASTLLVPDANPANLGPYWVVAANSYGAVTSSIANLYMYPSIVTPFTGVVTDWGQNTTLSIVAWGSGPLTFQWYDNGIVIPNATNSTLNFAAIQFTNAGSYSVVVSSSLGSVTNTAAQVVVNPAGVSLGLYPGLTITGTVGYTYNIQSNPDLTNPNGWTTVATVTLWQPTQFWVDVNSNAASPTNQHRYYRVLPVP